ncbi:lambda-crystallin-like [Babylonia areolata]|uniref:lambda-crystallin-like n=1 Tax=Babylonia areolata TaxID=304850 RepID=UPI003FD15244
MPDKIAIVGSGLIGQFWAMIFASGDFQVGIYDIDEGQVSRALGLIREKLQRYEQRGCLRGSTSAAQQAELITGYTDLAKCLEGACYLQECVPESVELKTKVFQQLDSLISDSMVAASSSSCLGPSQFAGGMKHKDRVVVAHPVNPPYFLTLVEIVPSKWTSADVVARTRAIMEKVGQAPVTLSKEVPGFALNRIQYAVINECWAMLQEGILSPEDIEKVMKNGLGPRYAFIGPLETMHLNADGIVDYCKRYADGAFRVGKTMASPPVQYDTETAEKVQKAFQSSIPVEKLGERRQWRDDQLAALANLKRQNDAKDSAKQ